MGAQNRGALFISSSYHSNCCVNGGTDEIGVYRFRLFKQWFWTYILIYLLSYGLFFLLLIDLIKNHSENINHKIQQESIRCTIQFYLDSNTIKQSNNNSSEFYRYLF